MFRQSTTATINQVIVFQAVHAGSRFVYATLTPFWALIIYTKMRKLNGDSINVHTYTPTCMRSTYHAVGVVVERIFLLKEVAHHNIGVDQISHVGEPAERHERLP